MAVNLLFQSYDTWTSKIIQGFTWSEYSHVDFIMPEGGLIGADGDGGVRKRTLLEQSPIKSIVGTVRCSKEIEDKVLQFVRDQLGVPYDWSAIFGIAQHRDWDDSSKWFCFEMAAAAFVHAEYQLLNAAHLNRVTGRDLMLSPLINFDRPVNLCL